MSCLRVRVYSTWIKWYTQERNRNQRFELGGFGLTSSSWEWKDFIRRISVRPFREPSVWSSGRAGKLTMLWPQRERKIHDQEAASRVSQECFTLQLMKPLSLLRAVWYATLGTSPTKLMTNQLSSFLLYWPGIHSTGLKWFLTTAAPCICYALRTFQVQGSLVALYFKQDLTVYARMVRMVNSQSYYLSLLKDQIADVCHHIWLVLYLFIQHFPLKKILPFPI